MSTVFETNMKSDKNPELFNSYQLSEHIDKFPNGLVSVALPFKITTPNIRLSGLSAHILPLSIQSKINLDPIRF
jgi:alpha 1,3-glucosidase